MANRILSIEIGNYVTRICQIDNKMKTPKVYRHVTLPTPKGAIEDGYLVNIPALRDAILKAMNDNDLRHTKRVIFTADSSKILNREVVIPDMKENMISSMIKTNVNDYFPIDLSGHEVSHLVLEKFKGEGPDEGKLRVLVMAAEKALVKDYEELAKACGLTLLQLDYVGNSIIQAFKNEDPDRYSMVLKIEEQQTSISVLADGYLLLQRSISYGVQDMIEEVQYKRAFGVSSYEEAWDLIRRKTCMRKSYTNATSVKNMTDEDEKYDTDEIFLAKQEVTASAMPLINAISRVVDFYNSRSNNHPINQLFVCGMGGDFSGLSKLIGNELGIKSSVLTRMRAVDWVQNNDDNDTGLHNYVACFGACIAPIGFYNKAAEDKEKHKTNFTGLSVLIILLTIVACGALFIIARMNYNEAKKTNDSLKAQEAKYQQSKLVYDQYQGILSTYTMLHTGSLMVENNNQGLLKFLDELEKKLPSYAAVVGFSSSDTQADLTIRVDSEAVVAGVVNVLRTFESANDVGLKAIRNVEEQITTEGDAPIVVDENGERIEGTLTYCEFTVSVIYNPSEYEVIKAAEEAANGGVQ